MDAFINGDYVFSEETVEIPGVDEYLARIRKEKPVTAGVFKDKICVFIGKLERCSRIEAQDLLFDAGGVPQNNLAAFVSFVILGKGAEHTKIYKEAKAWEKKGLCTLLTEQQFFDATEGKFLPSENPNKARDVIAIPATDPVDSEFDRLIEMKRNEYLSSRRIITKGGYLRVDTRKNNETKNEVQDDAD